MTTSLTELPATLDAGTTVKYTRSHAAYPASDGWALSLYLAGPAVPAPFTGAASGAAFDVTLAAASTATLPPGTYTWVERVTKGGEVYDAARGQVTVNANIATAAAGDLQSWEEKTLKVVEARIAGSMDKAIAEYQIHSRAVKYIPLDELRKLRSELKAAILQKKTGRFSTPIHVTFPPASGCGW